MTSIFDPQYSLIWMVVLTAALFFPVRQLIWVLSVRRIERKAESRADDADRLRLRRRAGATAVLLCFVFSFFYVSHLFGTAQ